MLFSNLVLQSSSTAAETCRHWRQQTQAPVFSITPSEDPPILKGFKKTTIIQRNKSNLSKSKCLCACAPGPWDGDAEVQSVQCILKYNLLANGYARFITILLLWYWWWLVLPGWFPERREDAVGSPTSSRDLYPVCKLYWQADLLRATLL